MQKVVVFLDVANVSKAARDLNIRINHEHLLKDYLSINSEGRFLQAAYAYVPVDPRKEHASDSIIDKLWSYGYVVKSKVGSISGKQYKCNFDVEISMDAMRAAYDIKPDIVTIISGDSDYIPLVLELRKMGIYVEMAAFKNSMSKRLISRASGYICLDNYYEECYSDGLYSDSSAYPNMNQEMDIDNTDEASAMELNDAYDEYGMDESGDIEAGEDEEIE